MYFHIIIYLQQRHVRIVNNTHLFTTEMRCSMIKRREIHTQCTVCMCVYRKQPCFVYLTTAVWLCYMVLLLLYVEQYNYVCYNTVLLQKLVINSRYVCYLHIQYITTAKILQYSIITEYNIIFILI